MNLDNITKIELEITSDCNAVCVSCARTQNIENIQIKHLTLDDIKQWFPDENYITGKTFYFCGVIGEPAFNPEMLTMIEYLVQNGGNCAVSTNGGVQPVSWWEKLGKISNDTHKLNVNFCVDGHRETNHIYRVNTNFDVIQRNMEAYTRFKGKGTWRYNVFQHNENEIDIARQHAQRLGLDFYTRYALRNSLEDWKKRRDQVIEKHKTKQKQDIQIQPVVPKELEKTFKDIVAVQQLSTVSQEIINSIKCKVYHHNEIFIAADKTVWPCPFLYDSTIFRKDSVMEKLSNFKEGWNSIQNNTINEVLQHHWFTELLRESWNPEHPLHLKRCIKSCALEGAAQTKLIKG